MFRPPSTLRAGLPAQARRWSACRAGPRPPSSSSPSPSSSRRTSRWSASTTGATTREGHRRVQRSPSSDMSAAPALRGRMGHARRGARPHDLPEPPGGPFPGPTGDEPWRRPTRTRAVLWFDQCTKDWGDLIPTIELPTLVVHGLGSMIPTECQQWVADSVAGAQFATIPAESGGSHFAFWETRHSSATSWPTSSGVLPAEPR